MKEVITMGFHAETISRILRNSSWDITRSNNNDMVYGGPSLMISAKKVHPRNRGCTEYTLCVSGGYHLYGPAKPNQAVRDDNGNYFKIDVRITKPAVASFGRMIYEMEELEEIIKNPEEFLRREATERQEHIPLLF